MLREMLTMSGMESSFTRAAITVYMDSDWVVKKTTTDCEYVVAYGMVKPSCTESRSAKKLRFRSQTCFRPTSTPRKLSLPTRSPRLSTT